MRQGFDAKRSNPDLPIRQRGLRWRGPDGAEGDGIDPGLGQESRLGQRVRRGADLQRITDEATHGVCGHAMPRQVDSVSPDRKRDIQPIVDQKGRCMSLGQRAQRQRQIVQKGGGQPPIS